LSGYETRWITLQVQITTQEEPCEYEIRLGCWPLDVRKALSAGRLFDASIGWTISSPCEKPGYVIHLEKESPYGDRNQ
jgi:hypothetical protein